MRIVIVIVTVNLFESKFRRKTLRESYLITDETIQCKISQAHIFIQIFIHSVHKAISSFFCDVATLNMFLLLGLYKINVIVELQVNIIPSHA